MFHDDCCSCCMCAHHVVENDDVTNSHPNMNSRDAHVVEKVTHSHLTLISQGGYCSTEDFLNTAEREEMSANGVRTLNYGRSNVCTLHMFPELYTATYDDATLVYGDEARTQLVSSGSNDFLSSTTEITGGCVQDVPYPRFGYGFGHSVKYTSSDFTQYLRRVPRDSGKWMNIPCKCQAITTRNSDYVTVNMVCRVEYEKANEHGGNEQKKYNQFIVTGIYNVTVM